MIFFIDVLAVVEHLRTYKNDHVHWKYKMLYLKKLIIKLIKAEINSCAHIYVEIPRTTLSWQIQYMVPNFEF